MGRHSKPGPGESFGEPTEPADSFDSPTGRFSRAEEPGDDIDRGEADEPDAMTTAARRRVAWEGDHRSEGGRRGVSIGVIAALITVVLVVGGVILWRFFGGVLSHGWTKAAQQCLAGTANVPVVADPSIADNLKKVAETSTPAPAPLVTAA